MPHISGQMPACTHVVCIYIHIHVQFTPPQHMLLLHALPLHLLLFTGSFNITPRMQRHFVTFAVQMPNAEIVRSIYHQIVDGHLQAGAFDGDVVRMGGKLVDATIELHRLVSETQ